MLEIPGVSFRKIDTGAIEMFVAEAGDPGDPLVVLCHGFPESWYSWRHQLPALAAAGYRVVAPDMRGFGETQAPADNAAYTQIHHVGDMVGLVRALGEDQAVIVGHDWGAPVAWNSALLRPDIFRAVAGLSVPYEPRGDISLTALMRERGVHGFYMLYFGEPGVAEAELEADTQKSLRMFTHALSGDVPPEHQFIAVVPEGQGLLDICREPETQPDWFTQADLDYYTARFEKSGFRGGLNWYRNVDRSWELLAPWHRAKLHQPSLFVAGTRDSVILAPAVARAIERLESSLPGLTKKVLLEGCGHWTQQERPEETNALLLEFLAGLD